MTPVNNRELYQCSSLNLTTTYNIAKLNSFQKHSFEPDLNQRPMDYCLVPTTVHRSTNWAIEGAIILFQVNIPCKCTKGQLLGVVVVCTVHTVCSSTLGSCKILVCVFSRKFREIICFAIFSLRFAKFSRNWNLCEIFAKFEGNVAKRETWNNYN